MNGDRMDDVVVLLPGITGSVLTKHGQDLWALSGEAALGLLTSFGGALDELTLASKEPDHDDGVVADRLMPDVHLVPGLVRIDGYGAIADMIRSSFRVIERSRDDPRPGNFFEFPYDWRRDNRLSATRLAALAEHRLAQWRDYSGLDDAKLILVGHSMGGLVARYYAEVLEGWPDCRAVITLGRPTGARSMPLAIWRTATRSSSST